MCLNVSLMFPFVHGVKLSKRRLTLPSERNRTEMSCSRESQDPLYLLMSPLSSHLLTFSLLMPSALLPSTVLCSQAVSFISPNPPQIVLCSHAASVILTPPPSSPKPFYVLMPSALYPPTQPFYVLMPSVLISPNPPQTVLCSHAVGVIPPPPPPQPFYAILPSALNPPPPPKKKKKNRSMVV